MFYDVVFNPKILDVIENLIGPNIQLYNTAVNLKPPGKSAIWTWRQDYPFFPHTNFDLLAVMLFLDDATRNGCLTVIPGSHRFGPLDHGLVRAYPGRLDRSLIADRSRWLNLPVPAGGMELHHCNMLHGSRGSRNDRPRSAMVIWYRAADSIQLAGPRGRFGWGLQVRGVNTEIRADGRRRLQAAGRDGLTRARPGQRACGFFRSNPATMEPLPLSMTPSSSSHWRQRRILSYD